MVNYSLQMRGKMSDDEEWNDLSPGGLINEVEVTCDPAYKLCSYFPVGYLTHLQYDMYDVAVTIENQEDLVFLEDTHINFHMAYFNPEYTFYQLKVRLFFVLTSVLVLLYYFTKLACRVPHKLQHMVTFDQRSVAPLLFLLFLFNDPWYAAHIYQPSVLTLTLSELQISMFAAGLLIYWIRDVARYRTERAPRTAGVFAKYLHKSTSDNQVVVTFLFVFYVLLVVVFTGIYLVFFFQIEADPGFAGQMNPFEGSDSAKVSKTLYTCLAVLLGIYYFWYLCTLCNHCRLITATEDHVKVVFAINFVAHVIFMGSLVIGAYSRHFRNGGI